MVEALVKMFINTFVCPHGSYPCIWYFIHPPNTKQTSEVVHLYSLNFSSSHIILILYIRSGMSNASCRSMMLIKDLILLQLLPLNIFLLHCITFTWFIQYMAKYLNIDTCSYHISSTRTSYSKHTFPFNTITLFLSALTFRPLLHPNKMSHHSP